MIHRVLDDEPCVDLDHYAALGGGEALRAARSVEPEEVVDALRRSGLRGRGGAGFPTATKWASVMANTSSTRLTSVIVNGAEGEPSTFKDRTILRSNPYRVLEGGLIACAVLQSTELVVCLKRSFVQEWARVSAALEEMRVAGWLAEISVRFVAGPSEYLFGEETALLEVIDGRQPFPRVTPPWRRGIDDEGDGTSAHAELASIEETAGVPALVNNVETFANVTLIVRNGPEWFREVGTEESPGTVVCTIVGDVARSGVGEFAMGTPLAEVIGTLGAGPREGRRLVAVLPGASGSVVGSLLALGAGLHAGALSQLDRTDDGGSETDESKGSDEPVRRRVLAPLVDIIDGTAVFDEEQDKKQPDWTFDPVDSGVYPAERLQNVGCDATIELGTSRGRRSPK